MNSGDGGTGRAERRARARAGTDDARQLGVFLATAGFVGLFVEYAPALGALTSIAMGFAFWLIGMWYIPPPPHNSE